MTKYLLKAWKIALDEKIEEYCTKHVKADDIKGSFKAIWYNMWTWVGEEIDNGNMLEEFKPFAKSYCEEHIRDKLEFYELFKETEWDGDCIS